MTITADALVTEYRKSGFVAIGDGMYASVYGKPDTDWVIKVGHQYDGYLAYCQFAITHGWIGTHAPYIYSIKIANGFYIAIMERLVMTFGRSWGEPIHDVVREQHRSHEWDQRISTIRDNVLRHQPCLSADFHDGNWMIRKDGTLVLTDPLSGETKSPIMTAWRNPKPRPTITPHPLLG